MDVNNTKFNFFSNFPQQSQNELPEFELNIDERANLFNQPVIDNNKSLHEKSRLNAFDIEILEASGFKSSQDDSYELEKLSKNIQKEIALCDKKIASKKFFADNDELKVLHEKKDSLSSQLVSIQNELKKLNQAKKVAEFISNSLKLSTDTKNEVYEKIHDFMSKRNFIPFFSGLQKQSKLYSTVTKLNSIQANVFDMLNSSVPYGESEKHYEALALQILKANRLQYDITQELL